MPSEFVYVIYEYEHSSRNGFSGDGKMKKERAADTVKFPSLQSDEDMEALRRKLADIAERREGFGHHIMNVMIISWRRLEGD